VYTIQTSFKRVGSVAFSTTGRLVALSGEGVWDCEVWSLPPDPEPVTTDGDYEPDAFGLAIEPRTGRLLHGNTWEGMVETDRENDLRLVVPGGPLRAFAVSPSGDRLVCGCELWTVSIRNNDIAAQLISFTRGGKQKHWRRSAVLEGDGFVFSDLAFFPDGKQFASIEWSSRKRGRERGDVPTLRVHDSKSLDELDATAFKRPASGLVVCGNRVIVHGDKSFRVWGADELSAGPVEVKTGRTPLGAIVADPHGRFVLTASGDSVSVWDADSWAADKTYEWAHGKITCLAVSPDGLLGVAGTATGKVIVWDIE
jgi:WD40 repeat protein